MTLVWVIYDIVKNKTRSKVVKICKDAGLYRVQKSVFLGDINSNSRDSVILEIESIIDPEADSVYIFPMDKATFEGITLLGQAFDKKYVSDEIITRFF
ncbi:CRISPR-associated protein Cas2 [Methanomicrobium sp. W14]|uniref:CRISPR-associated endonuclease Cas2 n=1 Tax=Methanomicrobium sp. W14 TaxID=2817839 RepID=UPI001AE83B91|nr:CRISPR-associated endonuclease Cas2 [Methanomicrobium sp. W14]MBP2133623.1 CRISPR-associated protein Cas2 [Methanomicrobium sp. W14]